MTSSMNEKSTCNVFGTVLEGRHGINCGKNLGLH
jgi:hypothetical protein